MEELHVSLKARRYLSRIEREHAHLWNRTHDLGQKTAYRLISLRRRKIDGSYSGRLSGEPREERVLNATLEHAAGHRE